MGPGILGRKNNIMQRIRDTTAWCVKDNSVLLQHKRVGKEVETRWGISQEAGLGMEHKATLYCAQKYGLLFCE